MPKIVPPPRVGPSLIPSGKGRRQIRVPQPHKVIMPPGKHNKLIPQKPQIFPKGHQKKLVIVPPKSVAPKMAFRSRYLSDNYNNYSNYQNYNKPLLCLDCTKAETRENERKNNTYNVKEKQNNKYNNKSNLRGNQVNQYNNIKYGRGKQENQYNKNNSRGKQENRAYQKAKSVYNNDNYKYHYINNTTDKKLKTSFVVKKDGVIISSNME